MQWRVEGVFEINWSHPSADPATHIPLPALAMNAFSGGFRVVAEYPRSGPIERFFLFRNDFHLA